jgi:cellobiose-specific phosphotransferase system component IIB
LSQGFSIIISRIIETIYVQKLTGAAAGLLNPNIIAREIGLAEKTENKNITIDVSDYVDYSQLSEEALKEITDAGKTKRLEGHS